MTDYSSSLSILSPLYLVISNLSFKPNSNPSSFVWIFLFGSPLLIPNLSGYIVGFYNQHFTQWEILFLFFCNQKTAQPNTFFFFICDFFFFNQKNIRRAGIEKNSNNIKQFQFKGQVFPVFFPRAISLPDVTTSFNTFSQVLLHASVPLPVIVSQPGMCSHILCPYFKTLRSDMLCKLFLDTLSQHLALCSLYSLNMMLVLFDIHSFRPVQ